MPAKDLPTYYYHTHFVEFLDYIMGPCEHLLTNEHRTFISTFAQLSKPEQCLFVRLINRKHSSIKINSLVFAEIPNISTHLDTLSSIGWISAVNETNVASLMCVLTKAELTDLYAECASVDMPAVLKSASKGHIQAQCEQLCLTRVATSSIAHQYVVRTIDSHIDYFLFLYFGHGAGKLNQFSMRDLGVMRTRNDDQTQMQSRFNSIEEATSSFALQQLSYQAKKHTFDSAAQVVEFYRSLPKAHGNQAHTHLHKLLLQLAKNMLTFDAEYALTMLADVECPNAQEFWCRQAYKLGQKDAVYTKLNTLIDTPLNEQIMNFAEDFLARKYQQKRTSVLTDMLRDNTRHLLVDETYKGNVERGVVAYYKARNIEAWRSENHLWNNLFGLVFWQELFELEGLGLATPFDYLPACIKHHCFVEVANEAIHERLRNIATANDLLLLVTKHASVHFGKTQGIVSWRHNLIDNLQVFIQNAPINGIKQQLLTMCSNYNLYNDGYPDIMVLENERLRFEEIKAPGDSLRRNQLMQIQHLKQAGFEVGVTTVDYTFDPMQPYAVVDIETTGGKANTHKITEIGAVKLVNGEVVDQWQTLLNPQRRIPQMITKLTGITNEMVADAPLFCDVADEFSAFTENCIFVAHNVNFDYGFIREEYARLNQTYRRPKLCTVQQMRKYYKGLSSYSLANLTAHFDIRMQRHHRALSDAIAASELLTLINKKRSAT